jgi:hypothetical protein
LLYLLRFFLNSLSRASCAHSQGSLDAFSEVDLYFSRCDDFTTSHTTATTRFITCSLFRRAHRKYDSNGNADRSGTGCYPDAYIQALLCRTVASSRGPGSAEAHERAKSKGFRSTFQGVFRPKVLNLR